MVSKNILKYNFLKLKKLSKNNLIKLVLLLEHYYYKPRFSPNLTGINFILNPGKFFSDSKVDILFKAQYLELASLRSYQKYKTLNQKYLDLTYYPDLNLQAIKHNLILTITENKIYFNYEE